MPPRNRLLAGSVAVIAAGVLIGNATARHAGQHAQVTVYAAASLTNAFPELAPRNRYSFGGSNTLAAQIRQGAPADVFASANTSLPNELYARKLCSKPVVFTRNALVIIVPKANPANVHGVYDLTKHGVRIDVAAPSVPVGGYTLKALGKMKLKKAVLANVVSQETDVREVLAKIALREADAGFVYSTDAKTVPGKVTVLRLPARAEPNVQYGICVVSSSGRKTAARAFVRRLLSTAGQSVLHAYGFLPLK